METLVEPFRAMFLNYYQNRRVFLTGHTGFKGSWLSLWLAQLEAEVSGYSLEPPTTPNLHEISGSASVTREWIADIRDFDSLRKAVRDAKPEIAFHLAAQPLVRESYQSPLETLEVNVMGTANLLEAIRQEAPGCAIVVITTDKCYENKNQLSGYREDDRLGGHDVYSMSKAAAELLSHSWRECFLGKEANCPTATARAGNVIGGGDYGADRILPDLVRTQIENMSLPVRSPLATRPWQHVLDCLSGYLSLGAQLVTDGANSSFSGAFNFGPSQDSHRTVEDLVNTFHQTWNGSWENKSDANAPHEAHLLHLSIEKASRLLDWSPTWDFETSVSATAYWYRERHSNSGSDMLAFTRQQLLDYMKDAQKKSLSWTK